MSVAGRRERGRGRPARRRPVLRHRRAVRRVPAQARGRGQLPGAREQRRDARQLPDPGRVHAVSELPQRQKGTVRVLVGRWRAPRAPRLRFRRTSVSETRRRVRLEQEPNVQKATRLVNRGVLRAANSGIRYT